jgi:hypothetical protein
MKSIADIKKAINELLPREQRELLNYIASLTTTEHSGKTTDTSPSPSTWPTEAESDLQYVIPELGYRQSIMPSSEDVNNLREDHKGKTK